MASIKIRGLDDDLKRRQRVRAAEHGPSIEDEVLEILREAVCKPNGPRTLGLAIRARFATLNTQSDGALHRNHYVPHNGEQMMKPSQGDRARRSELHAFERSVALQPTGKSPL